MATSIREKAANAAGIETCAHPHGRCSPQRGDDIGFPTAPQAPKARFATNEREAKAFCPGLERLGGMPVAHGDEAIFRDFADAFAGFVKRPQARRRCERGRDERPGSQATGRAAMALQVRWRCKSRASKRPRTMIRICRQKFRARALGQDPLPSQNLALCQFFNARKC